MIRRPPRSTLFPTRRSSDLPGELGRGHREGAHHEQGSHERVPEDQQRHLALLAPASTAPGHRSEEHTSELQSRRDLVCRLLLEKKKKKNASSLIQRTCARID